jgi:hypothetical protein
MEAQLKRAGTPERGRSALTRFRNEDYLHLKILTCMLPPL